MVARRASNARCRRLRLPNAWSTQKLLVWLWNDHWLELGTLVSETVKRRRAIMRARRRLALTVAGPGRQGRGSPWQRERRWR